LLALRGLNHITKLKCTSKAPHSQQLSLLPHHAVNFTVICCPLTTQTVFQLFTFSLAAFVSYYRALSHFGVSFLSIIPQLAWIFQRFPSLFPILLSRPRAEKSSLWHPLPLAMEAIRSSSFTLLPSAGFVDLQFNLDF